MCEISAVQLCIRKSYQIISGSILATWPIKTNKLVERERERESQTDRQKKLTSEKLKGTKHRTFPAL